jgi:hypothetical protein
MIPPHALVTSSHLGFLYTDVSSGSVDTGFRECGVIERCHTYPLHPYSGEDGRDLAQNACFVRRFTPGSTCLLSRLLLDNQIANAGSI